jgi:hypothetical protein
LETPPFEEKGVTVMRFALAGVAIPKVKIQKIG